MRIQPSTLRLVARGWVEFTKPAYALLGLDIYTSHIVIIPAWIAGQIRLEQIWMYAAQSEARTAWMGWAIQSTVMRKIAQKGVSYN